MTGAFTKGTAHNRATCFGYGDVDYVRRNRPSDPLREPPECFECSDVGHIRRYCPRKAKWHKAKVAESKEHRKGAYAEVFMGSVGSVKSTNKECHPWLIDLGASSDMTNTGLF